MITVQLNVDEANLGKPIEEMFASLSVEDRKEVARSVMLEMMSRPDNYERKLYEHKVFTQLKSIHPTRSDHEIRTGYDFSSRMKDYQSTTEKLQKEVYVEASKNYTAMVKELVENDPQMQERLALLKDALTKAFPELVQMAMTNLPRWSDGEYFVCFESSNNHAGPAVADFAGLA